MLLESIAFKVVAGLLVLGVLIFVHELGHFLVAKGLGVGVLEFAIGFGKKIWKRRIGETRYSIGLIPLGGYVRMVGDDPRELAENASAKEGPTAEFALQPATAAPDPQDLALMADHSKWFLEKGFLTKCAIVIAGPGFNMLFAWLLAISVFWFYGAERMLDLPVIGDTIPTLPAQKAGFTGGDRVLAVNGVSMQSWEELARTVQESGGKELLFNIERKSVGAESKTLEIRVTGQPEDAELALLNDSTRKGAYLIGIRPSSETMKVDLWEAIQFGSFHVWSMSVMSVRSLGLMVQGAISPKNIGGPITIIKQAAHFAEKGVQKLCLFMIFLSVSLAVINLLPIPILDGGHLAFFIIDLVIVKLLRGAPLSLRVKEMAGQVGLVLLLGLMFFAIGNDIVNIAN